jgi:hypothetical protein
VEVRLKRLEIEKDDGAEVGCAVLSPLESEQGEEEVSHMTKYAYA